MVDDALLHPPLTYSTTWALVGAALVLLALLTPVVIVVCTRPGGSLTRLRRRSSRVRRACLARIDAVEAAHAAGHMDGPTAASELSQALRRFGAEWSGVLYPAMTLAALAESAADPALRRAVESLYPEAFEPSGTPDVPAAAARAREVIRRWNRS